MQQSSFRTIVAGALAGGITTIVILQSPLATRLIHQSQSNQAPASTLSQSVPSDAAGYENAVIGAVKSAEPSVVSIVISKDVPVYERVFQNPSDGFFGSPFGGFFGSPFNFQMPQLRQNGTQKQDIGGGSGFIISDDGLIITNKHVVDQTDASYTVFLSDGSKHDATVVARDPVNDIAVIKIDGHGLPTLQFDDSDQLQTGQTVIAIGNALGEFSNSVSTGVISGLSRSITAGDGFGQAEHIDQVIQTDAAINPGNSGGPLLDLAGKVVGVNVAVAQGSQNVGFALPSNLVRSVVDSVKQNGKISRAYLGVRYTPITPDLKNANNLSVDYGVLVTRGESQDQLAVVPGSPANKAGIVEGDIILEADGKKLDDNTSLASVIAEKKVGDTVSLKILSKGQEKTVQVTLGEYPDIKTTPTPQPQPIGL